MQSKLLILCFILIHFTNVNAQNDLIDANQVLIKSIMSDNFPPPVASRIHLYSNVAAYEIFCQSEKKFISLTKSSHLSPIPTLDSGINKNIAAVSAFIYTGIKYIYTEDFMVNLLEDKKLEWARTQDLNTINKSILYGQSVANHIFEWSKGDKYGLTRTMHRFELVDDSSTWKPTPPDYANGLEPNWYLIRQVFPPSDSFYKFRPNTAYSQLKNSPFYLAANDVYKAAKTLTEFQKNTALYWDDNPMTTISKGHMMYVVKKPTPVGHWLKITSQILTSNKTSIEQSSKIYTMVSIAAFDAFINCWNVKYKTNSIRPETYIQRLIDPKFKPLIETPPFPEYTSGHSTVSASIATVLTSFFPTQKPFTDSSQIVLSMQPRKFNTIMDAAKEASISRFYGGIHFKAALLEGERMGKAIGEATIKKFR